MVGREGERISEFRVVVNEKAGGRDKVPLGLWPSALGLPPSA